MYLQQLITLVLLLLLCCSLACEFWSDDPEWYFNEEPPINKPDHLFLLPRKLVSFNDLVDKEHWVTFFRHWKVNTVESYPELERDSPEWLLVDDPEFFNDPFMQDGEFLPVSSEPQDARRLLRPHKAKPHTDFTEHNTIQKTADPDACIAVKEMIPIDLLKFWKT